MKYPLPPLCKGCKVVTLTDLITTIFLYQSLKVALVYLLAVEEVAEALWY